MKLTSQHKLVLISVLLAVITLAGYEGVRQNDFVAYDDNYYVASNPIVQNGLTKESVKWAFIHYSGNWHPLTWLSHMVDIELYGPNASGHHVTNLLFHIANVVLLFWVIKRMTGAMWCSVFVAGVFALHPTHVESVAWIAERKDLLSAFFFMLTLLSYVFYTEKRCAARYALVVVCFAFGLLSKPMLVTVPFVLLLLDYWPLGRLRMFCFYEKLPLLVLSGMSSAITFVAQRSAGATSMMFDLTLLSRISNSLASYVSYISKTFYPVKLAVLYPHPGNTLPASTAIGAVIVLLSISLAVFIFRKQKYLTVGWLWFLGMLVPVIGIVQVGYQAMADRYTYLPSIGLYIMLSFGVSTFFGGWRFKKILLITASTILAASMCLATRIQVSYWKDSVNLFNHAIDVTEHNIIMHNSMGYQYALGKQLDKATEHLFKAMRIDPEFAPPYHLLGKIYLDQNRVDEAIEMFNKAKELNYHPGSEIYAQLGICYFKKGKYDAAIENYEKALELKPDHHDAKSNLGIAIYTKGHRDKAIRLWHEVLEQMPSHVNSNFNLGIAMSEQKNYSAAIEYFEKTIEYDPEHSDALKNLSSLYKMKTNGALEVK